MRDDEQLRAALMDLRSDVATLPMRPPGQVRARGDQRTRRRRAALAGTSALAVAAVVVGTALTTGAPQARQDVIPPASSSSSLPPSPTPSAGPTGSGSAAPKPRPAVPLAVAVGAVDPASFLPARLWRGPDLSGGAELAAHPTWDQQGTVQIQLCDVDTVPDGDVGIAQVFGARKVVPVGVERLRRYATAAQATTAAAALVTGLRSCQQRYDTLEGNNSLSVVTADRANATSGDGVLVFRVGYGDKSAGVGATDWVAVFTAGGDGTGTVGTVVLTGQGPADTNFTALRRIAVAAREQAATTSAAPSVGARFAPPALPQDQPGAITGARFGLVSQALPAGDDVVLTFNEATLLSGTTAQALATTTGQRLRDGYYVQESARVRTITLRPGTPVWGSLTLAGSRGVAVTATQVAARLRSPTQRAAVWVYFGGTPDGPVTAMQEQYLP